MKQFSIPSPPPLKKKTSEPVQANVWQSYERHENKFTHFHLMARNLGFTMEITCILLQNTETRLTNTLVYLIDHACIIAYIFNVTGKRKLNNTCLLVMWTTYLQHEMEKRLTSPLLFSGISTTWTSTFLYVVAPSATSSAEGVRLVVPLTKTGCTFRLSKEKFQIII